MPISPVPAEIYVLGNEKDSPEALKMRWTQGIDMGSGITLRSHGPITQRGAAIAAEGDLSGSTNKAGRRIYVEARCSEFGICVSSVLVADNNSFDDCQESTSGFCRQCCFGPTQECFDL